MSPTRMCSAAKAKRPTPRREASPTLAHEHGFALWLGVWDYLQGWAPVERAALSGTREQGDAGLVEFREGLAALRAMGTGISAPLYPGAMAQGSAQGGQAEEGLGGGRRGAGSGGED